VDGSYLHDTLVLRTVFTTRDGSVAVTDALALEPGALGHHLGLRSPRLLARLVHQGRYREQVRRSAFVVQGMTYQRSGAVVAAATGVQGERDLTEHRVDHLRGYAHSRPVFVGNDAWRQRQTDVLGEVLDAAWLMRYYLDPMSPEVRYLLRALADQAANMWHRPDAGMWKAREAERHYLSSKVLDRAVRFGSRLGDQADVAR
jgi:GH15 family glucan-1,4-alpha-glucosidase